MRNIDQADVPSLEYARLDKATKFFLIIVLACSVWVVRPTGKYFVFR
jgi:hypothetical protein